MTFSELEDEVARVSDEAPAGLEEPLLQARQRPALDGDGQDEPASKEQTWQQTLDWRWRVARRCGCSFVRHVLRNGKRGDAAEQQDPTPAGSPGVRGVAVLAVRIVARLLADIVGIDFVGLDRLSGWAHRGRRGNSGVWVCFQTRGRGF